MQLRRAPENGRNPVADPSTGPRVDRPTDDPRGAEAPVVTRAVVLEPYITVQQVLRALAGLGWLIWGLYIYWSTFFVPGAPQVGLLFTLAGVAVLALAFLPVRWLSERWFDVVLLLGTLIAIAVWVYTAVYASPGYGTDEIAFQQGAAQVLLHGHNPYGANLGWAINAFRVPPAYQTQTLAGGLIHALNYPALSFLVYVPVLWLGLHAQAAVYVDAAFWLLSAVVLWWGLPARFKPVAPLVAMTSMFVGNAVGGTTDSLYLPFLLLALWRWDRFGDPSEGSAARWVGPVALGAACAFNQAPWFLAPFLLIGIAMEARLSGRSSRRATGRYSLLAAAAFVLPNLPFIIWSPGAWATATIAPVMSPLVPYGQGLIAFSLYLQRGGGDLHLYTLAGIGAMVTLLAALALFYPRLRRILPILPAIALLFPTRSLDTYFLYAVPGLLMAAATVRPVRVPGTWRLRSVRGRGARMLCALAGVATVGVLVLAVLVPPPIRLAIVGEHTTGQLQTVDQLTVLASNRTWHPVQPHFAVTLGPFLGSYWFVTRGPTKIPPHGSAEYVLDAPNVASMPGISDGFELYAMTPSPAAVSWTVPLQPDPYRAEINPQAFDRIVPNSGAVTLLVQVVDRLNQPVRRAGIRVALTQVLYTAQGLFPGETSINEHPEGESPVTGVTNRQGVAAFRVRAVQLQPYEVFYQAYIARPYPQGYSSPVSVRFGHPPGATEAARINPDPVEAS